MNIQLGIVMDPIHSIHFDKDSTLAMLWEATRRGWTIHYFEQKDLFVRDGKAFGNSRLLKVFRDPAHWFSLEDYQLIELAELSVILMRKDPPFNLDYIYTTYILELAERAGVKVFNKPQSLRDANEKFFTTWFPELCPPTLVTRNIKLLRNFYREQKDIICKPLAAMGGAAVFHLTESEANANVVFELLPQQENHFIMAQRFIPEISKGDKRILL
ncbi:MAG: gshB, partial [Gammaproteobacteria bacterium]|nr:gshB [Gammaproteobacteria bacterium]